jgi:hypothetical protein
LLIGSWGFFNAPAVTAPADFDTGCLAVVLAAPLRLIFRLPAAPPRRRSPGHDRRNLRG